MHDNIIMLITNNDVASFLNNVQVYDFVEWT